MKKLTVLALTSALALAISTNAPAQSPSSSQSPSLPPSDDDWLHVEGNQIVDQQGNPVWLTGANWFGFNTSERVFHGLWAVNLEEAMADLSGRGINILRIPISTELIYEWQSGLAAVPSINDYVNPELEGKTSLEIFDAVVAQAKKYGVKILIDVHSAKADNSGHFEPMWYNEELTSEIFYQTWEWMAERYKYDDTILAFDIENEPHGKPWADSPFAKWDSSTDESNWKHACETASKRVLAINPNLLVLCEGIESYPKDGVTWNSDSSKDFHNYWWGGNLRGVSDHPIDLGPDQDQLVYSPHIYGPSVYQQPWFEPDFTYESLIEDAWRDNWFYLYEEGTSPLLFGEWGGHMDGGQNEKWMGYARDLIVEHKLHHTFWCLNPNSGDTGGLWGYDWKTWDEDKYALLKSALWRDTDGKFVGLDHQVPLGNSRTGITVSEFYGTDSPVLDIVTPSQGSEYLPEETITITFNQRKSSGANIYIDGGLVTSASSSPTTITAPAEIGSYQLQLIALDSDSIELPATDTVGIQVVEEVIPDPEPESTISCEPGEADTWSDGFVLNTITVTNTGDSAVNDWEVELNFSADNTFDSGWGGVFSASDDGQQVTVRNLEWNDSLQPGASASFGLQGSHGGQFVTPDCVAD
ncbi:cellulase family glycosylhydrolase [Microbulbifer celer]|uniref:Endoglucanase n=1 Tax=Microbulbifer celer TaxID=435905 RepID=A0ABW3UDR9_9GAMM|nr:cellulase family glycosylhydrolase [Microbulbifer celer]UFN58144.1 cellulase family glycosylhydrolase [Microbulbifer celer]